MKYSFMYEAEFVDIVQSDYAYLVESLSFVLEGTAPFCKLWALYKSKICLQYSKFLCEFEYVNVILVKCVCGCRSTSI